MTDTAAIQSLIRDAERAEAALAEDEHACPVTRPKVRRARKAPAAPTPGVLATREEQVRYLLGGHVDAAGHAHGGRFTLVSRASGVRYTYRIKPPTTGKAGTACRKCVGGYWQGRKSYPCFTCSGTGVTGAAEGGAERLFVHVLTGPDNTSDYSYLGSIITRPHPRYEHGRKSKIGEDAGSAKGLAWYCRALFGGAALDSVEFWHEGRCGRCGLALTDPLSVGRGIGPECWEKLGL